MDFSDQADPNCSNCSGLGQVFELVPVECPDCDSNPSCHRCNGTKTIEISVLEQCPCDLIMS